MLYIQTLCGSERLVREYEEEQDYFFDAYKAKIVPTWGGMAFCN